MRNILKSYFFIMLILACVYMSGCSNRNSELEDVKSRDLTSKIILGVQNIDKSLAEKCVEYDECTLTLSGLDNEEDILVMKKAIQVFEEEYPGIIIEIVEAPMQDISYIDMNGLYEYVTEESRFYDLYKEHDVLELGAFGQEYLNMCTISGALQALPVSVTGKIFVFNENIFSKAGIEVPDSLEELLAAGEIFADVLGDAYYPLAINVKERMELLIYYLQCVYGREWIVNGVLQYNIEELQEGMEFLTKLEDCHVIPSLPYMRSSDEFTKDVGWSNGYYAGIFEYDSEIKQYGETAPLGNSLVISGHFDDLGMFKGGYLKAEAAFAVSSTCTNPREAAIFLNYISNCEGGMTAINDSFGIPLSRNAKAYAEEELLSKLLYDANVIALDCEFYDSREYMDFIENSSLYTDVLIGLSYGDYNVKEAARVFMGNF